MPEGSNFSWESPKGNRGGECYFGFIEDKYTSGVNSDLLKTGQSSFGWWLTVVAFWTNDVGVFRKKQPNRTFAFVFANFNSL